MSTHCGNPARHEAHDWWIEGNPGEPGPDVFRCEPGPVITAAGGWCAPTGLQALAAPCPRGHCEHLAGMHDWDGEPGTEMCCVDGCECGNLRAAVLVLPRWLIDRGGDEVRTKAEGMVIAQAGGGVARWSDVEGFPSIVQVEAVPDA